MFQFSCGSPRLSLGDICICNSEGQVCLINVQPNVTLKACNTVISSRINCVAYVPSHKNRRTGSSIKHRQQSHKPEEEQQRQEHIQQELISDVPTTTTVDSLLDIDSSEDDDEASTMINNDETRSLDQTSISSQCILLETDFNNEQQDTREATMWLGTDDGM